MSKGGGNGIWRSLKKGGVWGKDPVNKRNQRLIASAKISELRNHEGMSDPPR